MDAARSVKLIECPRDAMQGWAHYIPTAKKIAYINALLKVGFDTIDFGSFVSPKAIPQMADTREVVAQLKPDHSSSKLLAIIANERGAADALLFEAISYLGFPLSMSETFQQRNTNASIAASMNRIEAIQELCIKNDRELLIYLSMGFGNPYGDPFNEEIVFEQASRMAAMGIKTISLADTVGLASAEQVKRMTGYLVDALPDVDIGVHLHSTAHNWKAKVDAALEAGCRRFDGAIRGIGGCPMAADELVGNMNMSLMVPYFDSLRLLQGIDLEALQECDRLAAELFI